jgi:hypothetical protein
MPTDPSQFWQISVNGRPPVSFASQMLSNVRRRLKHTDVDSLSFIASGRAITAGTLMNDGDSVTVTRNGQPFFAGTALPPQLVGSAEAENQEYTIESPWRDLKRTFYQQQWWVWDGTYTVIGGILLPHVVLEYLSMLVLFMNTEGQLQTAQQELTDAVNFAIANGVSCQLGSIDLNFQPPTDSINGAISIAEIIQRTIRWAKDAVGFFDYTVSPPRLNIRQRANLPSVTKALALTAASQASLLIAGGYVTELNLRQRTDLVPANVVIQYIVPDTVNGYTSYAHVIDNATGGSATAKNVVPIPIQLQGLNVNYIEQQVTTVAIDTTSQAWWKSHCPAEFNRPGVTIVKAPYNNSNPTYPNEIVKGSFAAWMAAQNKNAAQETVYADIDIQFTDPVSGSQINETRHLSANITSSTIGVGGVTFQNITSFTLGEPLPPMGLAAAYLASLTPAQWEGSCKLIELECSGSVTPGCVFNVSGGVAGWAGMNAMVAAVDEDWDRGITEISLGVPNHLSVADLIELANVSRWRNEGAPGNYFIRAGGYVPSPVNLLPDTPPAASLSGAAASGAPTKQVLANPGASPATITHDSTPGGGPISQWTNGATSIVIEIGDLPAGSQAAFQVLRFVSSVQYNTSTGVLSYTTQQAYVLMTPPTNPQTTTIDTAQACS